jgi:plasmid stabilization system protein ParE
MTLRVLEKAHQEMREAARWYEDKRLELGYDFVEAVEEAYESIMQFPRRFVRVNIGDPDREIRRGLLRRFPYAVVFEIREDEIIVIAIAHAKRKPKYWQSRI